MQKPKNKPSKLGVGLAIGGAIGAAAALLFAPKSGRQNRKKIAQEAVLIRKKLADAKIDERLMDIFGETTDQSKNTYHSAKNGLIERLALIKGAATDIDYKKYLGAVDDVIKIVKKEFVKDSKKVQKLKQAFVGDYKKLGAPAKKKSSKKKSPAKKTTKKKSA